MIKYEVYLRINVNGTCKVNRTGQNLKHEYLTEPQHYLCCQKLMKQQGLDY